MAARRHSHLSPGQFGSKHSKDPSAGDKPKFGGGTGVKTMAIDSPKLPHPPKVHPHRRHAGRRTRRAR